jgi:hypothetical protein
MAGAMAFSGQFIPKIMIFKAIYSSYDIIVG